jgi:N-acyl-D-aspartate/D-glutamate deacylase
MRCLAFAQTLGSATAHCEDRTHRVREAARELDATGLIVAPGFVDLHTHYDAQIHWDPYCTISGWHGVTSVVLGNCGFGFAPCKPQDRERSLMMMTRTEQIPYESMKQVCRGGGKRSPNGSTISNGFQKG